MMAENEKPEYGQLRFGKIKAQLEQCTGINMNDIVLHDSIDSTNEWSLNSIKEGKALPFACFAEQQTHGRGRRGRAWVSPYGASINMSIALPLGCSVDRLGVFSLVSGMAVVRVLIEAGITGACIKWPNDVYVDSKKISGILLETCSSTTGERVVVVGIGLNYCLPDTIEVSSSYEWTDVVKVSLGGPKYARDELAGLLLCKVVQIFHEMEQRGKALLQEFDKKYNVFLGRIINAELDTGEVLQGKCLGINDRGELKVLIEENERVFNSAEISLKWVDS